MGHNVRYVLCYSRSDLGPDALQIYESSGEHQQQDEAGLIASFMSSLDFGTDAVQIYESSDEHQQQDEAGLIASFMSSHDSPGTG